MPAKTNELQIARTLQQAYDEIRRLRTELARPRPRNRDAVALVGAGCRFPGGVNDPQSFWELLRAGRDVVGDMPPGRWDFEGPDRPEPDVASDRFLRQGGFIDDVDRFDGQFFGIPEREASEMDPQQRLLLEVAWEAVESTGHSADSIRGSRTGVYVGMSMDDYSERNIHCGDLDRITAYSSLGNARSFSAGRIAYVLDLCGPVLQLDTTCSSSLLAVHLACRALNEGECDLALAGGVNLLLSPTSMVGFSRLQALSPDDRCRTFDARANGYVRGEGCGIVVLKRLVDAVADRDQIMAVVRISGVNHDGRSNGITAPNGAAQSRLIEQVLRDGSLRPEDVQYVEAHGTGTQLGDPIELAGLGRTLGKDRGDAGPLWVGSVKTNFGHLEAAAGVCGLLKAALCVQRGQMVPSLHFERPNPHVDWEDLNISVSTVAAPWPAVAGPRRAGVSAFGMSGTNVHMIVEQAPPHQPMKEINVRATHPFVLSADAPGQLKQTAARLARQLEQRDDGLLLPDVSFTITAGRSLRRHRRGFLAADWSTLLRELEALQDDERPWSPCPSVEPPIAALFTGQGSQYVGMGRELFDAHPVFRGAMEACHEGFKAHAVAPLLDTLWGVGPGGLLDATIFTQAGLFAIQYALGQFLNAYGVRPTVVLGHSVGEYAAACLAGVMDLEGAIRLVAARGRLMQSLPQGGGMAALDLDLEEAQKLLDQAGDPRLSIAAINSDHQVVLSGPRDQLERLAGRLAARNQRLRWLSVSHAFHSPLMEPMLAAFKAEVNTVSLRRPRCTFVSTVSGAVESDRITTTDYWVQQIRSPVEFRGAIATLAGLNGGPWVELGPKPQLLSLCPRPLPPGVTALPTLRAPSGQWESLLATLVRLTEIGVKVDWATGERPFLHRRASLPTYSFERQRHWIHRSAVGHVRRAPELRFPGRSVAAPAGDHAFEMTLGAPAPQFVSEHVIHGHQVMPGACHVSLVAASAVAAFGVERFSLDDLVFPRALVMEEGKARRLRLDLRAQQQDGFKVEISSTTDGGDDEHAVRIQHATGRLRSGALDALSVPFSPTELRERCKDELVPETLFEAQAIRGISLGPSFRWLTHVARGPNEAVATMQRPATAHALPGCDFLPTLLDAAFQLLGATADLALDRAYIPWRIDRIRVHGRQVPDRLVACARRQTPVEPEGGRMVGDIVIATESGEPLIEILGLEARSVKAADLAPDKPIVYRWSWAPTSRLSPPPATTSWSPLLVLGDPGGLGERLVQHLGQQGVGCALVGRGLDFARLGPDRYCASDADLEAGTELWRRLTDDGHLVGKVVHLWSLYPGVRPDNAPALQALARAVCGTVLGPARLPDLRDLSIIVRNAVQTEPSDPVDPMASALWSLGATIAAERALPCRRIDVGSLALEDPALVLELAAALHDDESRDAAIAWRRGGWHSARLLPSAQGKVAPSVMRPDASYLIVGGTGALGCWAADWLIDRGARHIVLSGRGSMGAVFEGRLAALRARDATVRFEQADCADPEQVRAMWRRIAQAGPPVRGIVHAAGGLKDRLLQQMTWGDFWEVFSVKAGGALWLDEVCADSELDFFVGFSSLTAALGSPGQANYAASNGFLDGLVAQRIVQGRPGLSIQWGPWARIGMAARLGEAARQRIQASGLEFLQPEEAAAALPAVWSSLSSPMLIARATTGALGPRAAPDGVQSRQASAGRANVGADLRALPTEQRRMSLAQLIRKQVAASLCSAEDTVPIDRPLGELGLTSLMVIDLSHAFSVSLGIDVPLVQLIEGPPIAQLADELAARMGRGMQSGLSVGDVLLRAGTEQGPVIVCVHAVGGDLDAYGEIVGKLPDAFKVSGVKAPGLRSTTSASPERLDAIAAEHVHRVMAARPIGTVHLCGWSLGGVIALEMARLLRARNVGVGAVILLDSFSPFALPDIENEPPAVLVSVASDLGVILGKRLSVGVEELAAVQPGQRTAYVFHRAAQEGLLPREPKHFEVFRANLAAMLRYVPTIDHSRVAIVHADETAATTHTNTSVGWRRWLPQATYHSVAGDHYSMMRGTNATQVAELITRVVTAARLPAHAHAPASGVKEGVT